MAKENEEMEADLELISSKKKPPRLTDYGVIMSYSLCDRRVVNKAYGGPAVSECT